VSNLFDLPLSDGLVDVLEGHAMVGAAMQSFPRLPLKVVSAGSSAQLNPDTIFSPQFGAMIQELAGNFDMVILDSPPILAVSDSVLISNVADATLLVVQWNTTPRDIVSQGVKVLRSNGAQLVGVVLNKVDFSKVRHYEKAGYASYSGGTSNYVSG
jgi:Mrp family chromosome partitioning ATPase